MPEIKKLAIFKKEHLNLKKTKELALSKKYCFLYAAIIINFGLVSCGHEVVKPKELESLRHTIHNLNQEIGSLKKSIHEAINDKNENDRLIALIDLNVTPEKKLMKKIVEASPQIINTDEGVLGTGVLVAKKGKEGYILSALHVIGLSQYVQVQFFTVKDADVNYIYKTIKTAGAVVAWTKDIDKDKKDLVLIKINEWPAGLEPLALASSESLNQDQVVWRFGFNDGYKWATGFFLNAKNPKNMPHQQVVMPVGHGASGGPVVNGRGELVGLLQNFYDSDKDVLTINDRRLYEYHLSSGHFRPIKDITEFLNESLK